MIAMTLLAAALRRLERSEKRVARMNARAAVRAAVRSILAAMDRDYPVIPKERRAHRATGLTTIQRKSLRDRKLRARGLLPLSEITERGSAKLADYAAVGIRVRVTDNRIWWAPAWTKAVEIGDRVTLARCKRSAVERAAMLSVAALSKDDP